MLTENEKENEANIWIYSEKGGLFRGGDSLANKILCELLMKWKQIACMVVVWFKAKIIGINGKNVHRVFISFYFISHLTFQ